MKLSIIVPVYNEEKTIEKVLQRVHTVELAGWGKEIIVVDDGSTDSSKLKIQNSKLSGLKTYYHEHNLGKGAAVKTGISHATGEYILIQDADTEYDPEDIKKLVPFVEKNEKVAVYGTRLHRLPHFSKEERNTLFIFHYLGNRFLSLITSILYGQWLTDMETCYKLFPRKAVENMTLHARGFAFEPEITSKLLKNGFKIIEVPITTTPRDYGEGKKLQAWKDGPIALWTLVKYRFIN